MKQLTKAEEEVMQILWLLKHGSVKQIVGEFKSPKPAYNTVSTIVRILEDKGFVGYEKHGRFHIYHPLIKKEDYSNQTLNKFIDNYFQGSFKSMVSFFVKENDLSVEELESVLNQLKK